MGLLGYFDKNKIEAGCDEAGRGCLAGPVCAAAVILPKNYSNDLLDDSKKLSEKTRNILRVQLEQDAVAFAVAMLDNNEIDKLNILKASILAMHEALNKLNVSPEHIIIDGNRFIPYKNVPHTCIVKGDSKYLSIAAASILAKTYRDEYMEKLDKENPHFNWKKNKGYPTKEHRLAIKNHGITKYHRKTFNLLDKQLEILFK